MPGKEWEMAPDVYGADIVHLFACVLHFSKYLPRFLQAPSIFK